MQNIEKELLKDCLNNTFKKHGIANMDKVWYQTHDTLVSVANILDEEGDFHQTSDVIQFFEKPWKWEHDMQELINDY